MNLSWKLCVIPVSCRSLGLLAVSFALLLSTAPAVFAQSASTGVISGLVTDQQGAVMAGAEIRIVESSTSSVRTAVTNSVGRYTLVDVAPGSYDVSVSKSGFSTSRFSAQNVEVGQSLLLNVALQIGATSTTVEVTAAAGAELQTLSSTIGTTLRNQALQLLPNLGRDASTLSVLQVGVAPTGNVAGAATDQNSFQLDGGNNSDDMAGGNTTYTPGNGYSGTASNGGTPTGVIPTPIESIEEFKVGTSNQTADFNGAAGSQVQMITKRGNNAFHGALYEFYFGSDVGAANLWKNNHTLVNGKAIPLPNTHRNRFGGAIGGPLTPKFWGGKTYFFLNYEGMRFPNTVSFERGVPTELLRLGVIQLAGTAYNLNPVPVTYQGTTYQPAMCGGSLCDPRGLGLNPIISQIWKTMPLPNDPQFSSGTVVDSVNAQGYLTNLALPQTADFGVVRLDHDFGDKWKFMSSYRYYRFSQLVNTQTDIGGLLPGAVQGQATSYAARPQKPSYLVAGLTTTISPNLTNDFRFSYLRNFWQWGTVAGPPQLPGLGGAVEIGGESRNALIPYNVNSQDVRQRFWDGHDYDLSDSVSLLRGNHLFQLGGNYQRNFDFHGRNDNGVGINTSPTYQVFGGSGISNAAYPTPAGLPANQLTNWTNLYNEVLGIVIQPQIMYSRSGSNLTLNPVGTPGFDQSVIPSYSQNYNPTVGFENIRNIDAKQKYPFRPFYAGFSPRVSLAWNPNFHDGVLGSILGSGKTVIRGGYGRIYGRLNGVDLVLVPLLGTGLLQAVSCIGASRGGQCLGPGGVTPPTAFRIGADGLTAPLPAVSQTLSQPYFPGVNGNAAAADGSVLDPKLRPNHSDEFNFTIQRSFSSKLSMELGYMGRKIANEFQVINTDAVPYMYTLNGQSFATAYANVYQQVTGGQAVTTQPFFEAALGGPSSAYCAKFASCTAAVASNEAANIKTTQVYALWLNLNKAPGWTQGGTLAAVPAINGGNVATQLSSIGFINSLGHGNYNAVFMTFTARDWRGLTAQSNFTWGRALGTGSVNQASSSITVPDPYNFDTFGSYGVQPFDFLLGDILGGWSIAPLFTWRSGQPVRFNVGINAQAFGEVYGGSNSANYEEAAGAAPYTGDSAAHYNVTSGSTVGSGGNPAKGGSGINMFADPAAIFAEFRRPILGVDTGSGGAGVLRGFGFWNLDATISKDFKATERLGATLSFQITNVLNHFQPEDPFATSSNILNLDNPSTFGVVTNQFPTAPNREPWSLAYGSGSNARVAKS